MRLYGVNLTTKDNRGFVILILVLHMSATLTRESGKQFVGGTVLQTKCFERHLCSILHSFLVSVLSIFLGQLYPTGTAVGAKLPRAAAVIPIEPRYIRVQSME